MWSRQKFKTFCLKTTVFLASPAILFYALPILMALLVSGTIAQRSIGLYQAQKMFFGSFLFWLGSIPLPGAYTILTIIAVSLTLKLSLKSPFKKEKAGTLLAHFSILILLLGGLLSSFYREEGYIVLLPLATNHTIIDYHARELAILKNGAPLIQLPYRDVFEGEVIKQEKLPFSVQVINDCYYCELQPRRVIRPDLRGKAEKEELVKAPLLSEDEKNEAGITYAIQGLSPAADGTYVAFEGDEQQPLLHLGHDTYEVIMRHAERELPFSLKLIDFDKTNHPGTEIAKSYRSQVEVTDGGLSWNATIEMNQPLRYRGYTIYQSSFIEHGGQTLSVLAIVRNRAAWFPYLSILLLCVGLFIHVILTQFKTRMRGKVARL